MTTIASWILGGVGRGKGFLADEDRRMHDAIQFFEQSRLVKHNVGELAVDRAIFIDISSLPNSLRMGW